VAVGIGAALSIALVAPAFVHYVRLQGETGFSRSLADAAPYSAYFRSYLASAAHAHNWMLPLIRDWNQEVLFPGFLAIALAVLGVMSMAGAAWISGSSGASVRDDRQTAVLYGTLGLIAFWASLGPRAGLYTLLFNTVPVFSLLRAPGRTGIVVVLVLALFAGFGVRWLRRRTSGRASRVVAAGCCVLALAELNGIPFDWREARPISPAYDVLARMPRGPVAEFPFYDRRSEFHLHTFYMLSSTRHWHPLLNGYSDFIPPDFRVLAATLASFPSRESFDALRRRRARYIVLHRELYGGQTAPQIESRLEEFSRYLRPVASDGTVLIFEIVEWPR
jgi:hypothetical protein